jgi:hypothetical protein
MRIKYKVLKPNRHSVIVPENSKFCLVYEKDQIVKSVKGSIGIMVFKSKSSAVTFAAGVVGRYATIIKVRPIGRARKVPPKIAAFNIHNPQDATTAITEFNMIWKTKKEYGCYTIFTPYDTECYSSVEVLE